MVVIIAAVLLSGTVRGLVDCGDVRDLGKRVEGSSLIAVVRMGDYHYDFSHLPANTFPLEEGEDFFWGPVVVEATVLPLGR